MRLHLHWTQVSKVSDVAYLSLLCQFPGNPLALTSLHSPSLPTLESELAVQEALNELLINRFGMTTIIIAHRLQTVRSADTIFVLENGSVVEQGSHNDLVQHERGHYRRMIDRMDSTGHLPE